MTARWPLAALRGNAALIPFGLAVAVLVGYPILASLRLLQWPAIERLFTMQSMAPLGNSIILAFASGALALAIGVPLAWLCARTDLPGRRLLGLLVAVSLALPTLLTAIAYVFLFGRNAGLVNAALAGSLGGPLWNVISFSGVVFVCVMHGFPLVFMTTMAGLERMNPELEEAGRVCGLGPMQVFFRVTLGAILPSILAGLVFVIAESLTVLAIPLVLGVPVGIRFATTELYATIAVTSDLTAAVALSLPLVLVTSCMIWAQSYFVGDPSSKRFAMMTGKGAALTTVALKGWRWVLCALAWVPVFLALLLPVATLFAVSLMERWWRGFDLGNVSLNHFVFLLRDGGTQHAIVNSLVLALGVAAAVAALSGPVAIVLSGDQTAIKRLVRRLTSVPLGIPHVVAAVMVILAWFGTPFRLGGTLWILALGFLLVMLPYGVRVCEAAHGQIDASLAEAARVSGCSQPRAWRHVTLPLMRGGLMTSFVIVFVFVIKEFSLTAMLYSARTETLSVRVYALLEGGSFERSAAAAMLLLVLTFGSLLVVSRLTGVGVKSLKA